MVYFLFMKKKDVNNLIRYLIPFSHKDVIKNSLHVLENQSLLNVMFLYSIYKQSESSVKKNIHEKCFYDEEIRHMLRAMLIT